LTSETEETIRQAARHSIGRFSEVGVLESRRTRDESVKVGLL